MRSLQSLVMCRIAMLYAHLHRLNVPMPVGESSPAGEQCSAISAVQPSGAGLHQCEEHRQPGLSAHAGCALRGGGVSWGRCCCRSLQWRCHPRDVPHQDPVCQGMQQFSSVPHSGLTPSALCLHRKLEGTKHDPLQRTVTQLLPCGIPR